DAVQPTLDHEADHAAEAVLLPPGQIVLRVTRQAGIDDSSNISATLEPGGDGAGVVLVALHAYVERLDAAEDEEAVHRRRHGADGVLQEGQSIPYAEIARRRRAPDDVRVAVQVFRRRVHHDVGAEVERPLEIRRQERVIDDHEHVGTSRLDGLGHPRDITQFQHRVGRRLDPYHAGPGLQRGDKGVRAARRVDVREVEAHLAEYSLEEPIGSAVQVIGGDDVVAGRE